MNPYNGNPANDPVTIQIPDDTADLWTASVVNTPTQALADSIAYLRSRTNQCSNNWPNQVSAWSGSQVGGGSLALQVPPIWDGAYQRWLVGVNDGSNNPSVLQSFDGYKWTTTSVAPLTAGNVYTGTGLAVRQSDGAFMFFSTATGSSPGNYVSVWTSSGITNSPTGPFLAPGAGHWISGGYARGSTQWVAWEGGSTLAPRFSNSGGAWTNALTWSPPAGFTIHDRAHIILDTIITTFFALFPAGTSIVSVGMSSTDGENWASFPMPTFTLSGEAVIDVAYDTFSQLTYLLTGNSTNSNLWVSSTLLSWTLVRTFTRQLFGLRACGRELLLWASFAGLGASGLTMWGAFVSIDGGVTWRGPLMPRTLTAPANYFKIAANGSQFIYCNATEYAQSSVVGAPPVAVV